MRRGVVAIDRVVLDGATLSPAQAEAFRDAVASRLAEELRGWDGPSGSGASERRTLGDVPEGLDPAALSREVAARLARMLRGEG